MSGRTRARTISRRIVTIKYNKTDVDGRSERDSWSRRFRLGLRRNRTGLERGAEASKRRSVVTYAVCGCYPISRLRSTVIAFSTSRLLREVGAKLSVEFLFLANKFASWRDASSGSGN